MLEDPSPPLDVITCMQAVLIPNMQAITKDIGCHYGKDSQWTQTTSFEKGRNGLLELARARSSPSAAHLADHSRLDRIGRVFMESRVQEKAWRGRAHDTHSIDFRLCCSPCTQIRNITCVSSLAASRRTKCPMSSGCAHRHCQGR
eukprot:1207669-Amphidinium_carterae.1